MKPKGFIFFMKKFFLILLFLVSYLPSNAQSMVGTVGLLKAPNARLLEKRHFTIGTAYVPPGYFRRTSGYKRGYISGNAGLNYFVNLNLLPFLDVMFRYSAEMNVDVVYYRRYFPDKMFAFKLRVLEEKGWRPAIVIGANDFTSAIDLTSNSYYSTAYLVASKKLDYLQNHLDVSLGVAPQNKFIPAKDFKGVFLGLEYKNDLVKNGSLLIDYEMNHFNVGARAQFFKRFNATIGIYDLKKSFFTLSYEVKL